MIVLKKISQAELVLPFVKAAVDVEKGVLSLGCDLHIDCAEELIQHGSASKNIWGFNIYPDHSLDFISLINIRPSEGNRSMEIKDDKLQAVISAIVKKFLPCPVGNDEKI